jgi:hypothetical protein
VDRIQDGRNTTWWATWPGWSIDGFQEQHGGVADRPLGGSHPGTSERDLVATAAAPVMKPISKLTARWIASRTAGTRPGGDVAQLVD